ncbi:YbaK/EbsC family protein [Streptosporangium sp. NBC_01639]|uniref:YbaK/EbsC family protein n=1 Tax=Streptosporangium sp. NBC_01639 TaxID=2975948 RepID=UPI00386FEA89|nr:YbaK/EbsC family protein [Streptosporangium sp. NBC_01639]
MAIGTLDWVGAAGRPDLLAEPVARAVAGLDGVEVAEIDPALADTAAFCERYGVAPGESANCVIVAAKRAGEVRYAACMVLATTRADVNGVIRRHLDARKISFAPQQEAVGLTGMEYGGITPLGLPEGWPVLVDEAVAAHPGVVIGSGVRHSKLAVPGAVLAGLKTAEVLRLAN